MLTFTWCGDKAAGTLDLLACNDTGEPIAPPIPIATIRPAQAAKAGLFEVQIWKPSDLASPAYHWTIGTRANAVSAANRKVRELITWTETKVLPLSVGRPQGARNKPKIVEPTLTSR
jgi:hypothetical protein